MENIKLYDIIKYLQKGSKLHIGVLFFGNYGNEMCNLPFFHQIHAGEVCVYFKNFENGYDRCFACRNRALEKAHKTKTAFGGFCKNGVYEYTHPVIVDDNVACIIFIGNIHQPGSSEKGLKNIKDNTHLLNSMEKNYSPADCEMIAKILDSHIKTLLKTHTDLQSDSNPIINNIKSYINSNIEFDININHISKMFHYNETYLGRLFKKKTGASINDYINEERIRTAKKLLSDTDKKIIEIAAQVGFNNVTYFNRMFKKQLKITPSEYRKTVRNRL